MQKLKPYLLILLAVIVGEVGLIVLSSLVQEVLFDGIFWTSSSNKDLLVGGFLTFLAAVVPGYLVMWILQGKSYAAHIIISVLILTETTWLIISRQTPDPVWFDALAGVSLVVGVFLGGWLKIKMNPSPIRLQIPE